MRVFALAIPFLAVPLAAAGCGGGRSGSSTTTTLPVDPTAAVAGAALRTTQSGSQHIEIGGRVAATGQRITFAGKGVLDTKAHSSSMSVDFNAGGLAGAFDEVSEGTNLYVKSDLLTAMLPGNKEWVKLDLANVAKSTGTGLSSLLSQDPRQALAQLKSLRNVKKVGEADVDGTTLTHYRGRIGLATLTGGGTGGTGRYDVWIGDDGYVHRVKGIVRKGGTTSSVTTDLSAFGDPVTITVPPASQVYVGSTSTIPGLGG
jgi:hypothetical protein